MEKQSVFKYEEVQGLIRKIISENGLKAGDKVPSIRKMSTDTSLSVSTIMKAYVELEHQGILESRPQSGFYVSADNSIPSLEISAEKKITVARVDKFSMIYNVCNAMADKSLIQFGGASPCISMLPSAELAKTLKHILNHNPDFNSFEIFRGNAQLRSCISMQMLSAGLEISPNEIIITTGTTESLSHILRVLFKPGDCIVTESPLHFGHLHTLESMGLYVIEIPSRPEQGMDPDRLRDALDKYNAKALLIQPNFSNPMGGILSDEDKKRIVDICAEKNVPIIEDDVYGELCHEGHRPRCLSSFDKTGNVIYVSSFTKTISPSFRVGWICPGRYYKEVMDKKISTVLDTSRLLQLALADYLLSGKFSRYLNRVRRMYRSQVAAYRSYIGEFFPEGTRVSNPKGGYILWMELPESVDSFRLYEEAMKEGIGIVPGFLFTAQDRYRNFIRLNCGSPLDKKHTQALKKLGAMAVRLAGA
ncbi:MAG: PLP-dependent aminotransferase family protein [Deferribacterales bacterium]